MVEEENAHRGRCDNCGKVYRVPDPQKTYSCKACGDGKVRCEDAGLTCPECDAINPPASSFCEECGAALDAGAQAAAPRDRVGRREASHDLAKAYRAIRRLRYLYTFFAVSSGALTLILGVLLMKTRDSGVRALEEGRPLLLLNFVAGLVNTSLLVVVVLRVTRKPFFWSVLVAALQTVSVVASLIEGDIRPMGAGLCMVLWGMVFPMVRVQSLIEQHPDLYVARRIRGEKYRKPGTGGTAVSERARERRRLAAARAVRTKLTVFGGIGGGLLLLVGGYLWTNRPQSFESARQSFVDGWNKNGPSGVVDFFPNSEREIRRVDFRSLSAARGWRAGTSPRLEADAAQLSDGPSGTQELTFPLKGGELHTLWKLEDKRWTLVRFRLPLGDLPERLFSAWNKGASQLGPFFSDAEAWQKRLDRMLERRGWERLPRIESFDLERSSKTQVKLMCTTPEGLIEVRMRVKDDRWIVTGLVPPKGS